MPSVAIVIEKIREEAYGPVTTKRLLNTATSNWHAPWAGGAPINATAGFATPSTLECDRIPELALAGGGAPGAYVLTGTYNGAAQTDTITTIAGATVKGLVPFDGPLASFVGPDPGAALTLNMGDSYCDPPPRLLETGSADGNIVCQLKQDAAIGAAIAVSAQSQKNWAVRRIQCTTTTLTQCYLYW